MSPIPQLPDPQETAHKVSQFLTAAADYGLHGGPATGGRTAMDGAG